jgi:Sec-independent protein secretion pathway component TatC
MAGQNSTSFATPLNKGGPSWGRTLLSCALCFLISVGLAFVLRGTWQDQLFAPVMSELQSRGLEAQVAFVKISDWLLLVLSGSLLVGGVIALPVVTWLLLRQTAPGLFKPALIGRVWLLVCVVPLAAVAGVALAHFVTSPKTIANHLVLLAQNAPTAEPLRIRVDILLWHLSNMVSLAAIFVAPFVIWAGMRVRDLRRMDRSQPA